MTQEDKLLLLVDLCGRLPYGVKVKCPSDDEPYTLLSINWNKEIVVIGFMMDEMYVTSKQKLVDIKPYLRPMSSMTEEEKEELLNHVIGGEGVEYFHIAHDGSIDGNQEAEQDLYNLNLHWLNFGPLTTARVIDWLNQHHFDYRGLIERNLAIDCSNLNIYD